MATATATETIIAQGTAEWYRQRLGKATASRMGDLTAKTKTGWGAPRGHYLMQLVVERLTGDPIDRFTNAAMEWGMACEMTARLAYSEYADVDVQETGFIDHPSIPWSGASPDGLIGRDGQIQIKCPTTATHLKTLLGEPVDPDYVKQMQWEMACTKRDWCDYVSYDPRVYSADLRLYIKRFYRDDAAIAALEGDASLFLAEVDEKIAALAALVDVEPGYLWAIAA